MTQAQRPQFPATSRPNDVTAQQRTLSELGRLVQLLQDQGIYLQRSAMGQIVVAPLPAGQPEPSLLWGQLNRVVLTASANIKLPAIAGRYVGMPLYLAKLSSTGTLTLIPSGRDVSGTRAPLINNATSRNLTSVGLYTLITDGMNWFV